MKYPHSSYDAFIKKQIPNSTDFVSFVDWYENNKKVGDFLILDTVSEKTRNCMTHPLEGGFESFSSSMTKRPAPYYKDFFLKKLQLCENILNLKKYGYSVEDLTQELQYELEIAAKIMDLYETIIHEISTKYSVAVCYAPRGIDENKRGFETKDETFKNFDEFMDFLSTGLVVVYWFYVKSDFSICCQCYKWESLTRKVLVEKQNNAH